MTDDRAHLLAVARGDAEPDLVVDGRARLRRLHARMARGRRGRRPAGGSRASAATTAGSESTPSGALVVPGFIDAHVHIESSKLLPAEFARVVVPRGTTAVVCDPHEIANVLGVDGAHWLLDASAGLPLRVYAMAPSCVPASALESPRMALGPGELAGLLRRRRVLGVAEVMDFPAVVAGDPAVLAKVALHEHVDGHAPGVARPRPRRLRGGRHPLRPRVDHVGGGAREAPARDVGAAARGLDGARPARRCSSSCAAMVPSTAPSAPTTARPTRCSTEGHIDSMCRTAVAEGIAPEDALLMATLHGARCHRLADLGAIAPGYRADMAVLESLTDFRAAAGDRRRARRGARRPRAAVRRARRARVGARDGPAGAAARRRVRARRGGAAARACA